PTSQPAISSTAWSASAEESRPAWQQFTEPAQPWEQQSHQQHPSPRPPAESSSSWQQLVGGGSAEPWQRDAIEGTATWTDSAAQSSTKDAESMSSWLRMEDPAETPSWQT